MRYAKYLPFIALMLCIQISARAATPNTLVWEKSADLVSADIRGEALMPLLQDIAHQTGWQILVEPGSDELADVKFNNLPPGDALKKLLGDLNYALVPQSGGPDILYVFSTTMQAATKPVAVAVAKAHHVPNEILVKLKPGVDADIFAKAIGAKVIGRNDKLHMYLLELTNAATTDIALSQMQNNNTDVDAVSYNNIFDSPAAPLAIPSAPISLPALTLNASSANSSSSPLIGLIDTVYQPSGTAVDTIMKPQISVVSSSTGSSQAVNADSYGGIKPMSTSTTVPTHGTAMAQAIYYALAQATHGHTSVKILPVNVYESGDTTTSWDVALGVQAAVDNGAKILNMSLGGTDDSPVLDSIVQQALAQGVVIFAAAGNTPVASPTYPAAIPGVNAVTALSAPGKLASYANFGSFVEMALPGTSYVFLNNQAYVVQGTSPATAYATGMAAAAKSANTASWAQIESAMAQKFPVPSP
jgi:thermitase